MRRSPRLPLDALAPYLLPAAETAIPLDGPALFGNDHPVEVEVGFGKGLFLIASALARPEVNFLGIEVLRKYQLFTAARLARRGLGNVRVVCADARLFLRDRMAASSVQVVHAYFPDPWWKKRHHKRRVFTPEFVAECTRVLRACGRLSVATDVPEYATVIAGLVAAHPDLHPLSPPEPSAAAHDLDYLTNFERKFRKQGKAIYRMLWEKREASTDL